MTSHVIYPGSFDPVHHRSSDVTDMAPNRRGLHGKVQRLLRYPEEGPGGIIHRTHREGPG